MFFVYRCVCDTRSSSKCLFTWLQRYEMIGLFFVSQFFFLTYFPFLSLPTCDVLRFPERDAFPFVHILTQVHDRVSHSREISVSINFVRHETKCFSSVNESWGPVITPLFRVRLVWMIKVKMSGLGQDNL